MTNGMSNALTNRCRGRSGWSLIELTIILICLSILSAIIAPVIGRYVRNAKVIRTREDVQAIASAIWMFIEDTGNSYFVQNGRPGRTTGMGEDLHKDSRVEMLVSDGDIPELGPNGHNYWVRPVELARFDFLEYHLVSNRPGDNPANAYRTPRDMTSNGMFSRSSSGGFNSEFAWRGPYLTGPVDPDPWGNRYCVNVKYLDPKGHDNWDPPGMNGYERDCVVISAGPDEEIDSNYKASWPGSPEGLTPGDDDIICMVSANSTP